MKTLGLLGGMTFNATAVYYDVINQHVRRELGGRRSAPLYLYSADQEAMLQFAGAGQWDQFAQVYINAARTLIAGGAEAIVICAGVAHRVADDIEREIDVPLLHIADFIGQEIQSKGLTRVALLGTQVVMEGSFIKDRITAKFGIEILVPDAAGRLAVNDGIINGLALGRASPTTKAMFVQQAEVLIRQGAQGLILGSTDLGFAIGDGDVQVPIFDSGQLHAMGVARWALGK